MSNISQTAMNDCLSTTSWSTFIPLLKVALSENHLEFKVFHFDGIPSSWEWRPKLFHGNSKNYIFNVCTLLHTSDFIITDWASLSNLSIIFNHHWQTLYLSFSTKNIAIMMIANIWVIFSRQLLSIISWGPKCKNVYQIPSSVKALLRECLSTILIQIAKNSQKYE